MITSINLRDELVARLGVATISRNEADLINVAKLIGENYTGTEIQAIWHSCNAEFNADDLAWIAQTLGFEEEIKQLSIQEQSELNVLETEIGVIASRHFKDRLRLGEVLGEIKYKKLYLQYGTWDFYCENVLPGKFLIDKLRRRQLDYLIVMHETINTLGEDIQLPSTQKVLRELSKIKDIPTRRQVWQETLTEDSNPSPELVKEVRLKLQNKSNPQKEVSKDVVQGTDISLVKINCTNNSEFKWHGYWGRLESIVGDSACVVVAGLQVVVDKADAKPVSIDVDIAQMITDLSTHKDSHVRAIALTFHKYITFKDWQIELLVYLKNL